MIKNCKVDFAGARQKELQLIKTVGSYNTWRVYFNIHEHEDERQTTIVEVPVKIVEKVTEENVETGETCEYEIERTEIQSKEVTYESWESNYVEITKHVNEDVTAVSILKELILKEISEYDTSIFVNSFKINDAEVWLDKDTRVGLMNSTSIRKAMGYTTTTLWLGTVKLEIECDMAIQLLGALEMYALECFNKTAEHKKNVMELTTVEELVEYDYTTGYPQKLEMTL